MARPLVIVADRPRTMISTLSSRPAGTLLLTGAEDDSGYRGALTLAAASKGNAIGVGLADFITRELRDAIDEHKTLINVLTTGEMSRAKIPATYDNAQQLIDVIRGRFGDRRWMIVPNTLHLDRLYVSGDLVDELAAHPRCTVGEETHATFADGRLVLPWRCS